MSTLLIIGLVVAIAAIAANFSKIRAVIYDTLITSMTAEWYVLCSLLIFPRAISPFPLTPCLRSQVPCCPRACP